jgi:hypothetical protein
VATSVPADAHEWVSFPDPEEERTWIFDVTFMESNWTCIFGNGCQGVLTGPAPELVQGCCSYGAHFTGKKDVKRVAVAAATLTSDQWQFRSKAKPNSEKGSWRIAKTGKDGDLVTRMVDGACIFLNRPGFPGGPGCALHRAAMERGVPHMTLKPDVCWQLPLRREDSTSDEGWVTSTVRQWDRRDWGEGGYDFHWWCTESPEAFVGLQPVWKELQPELEAMVGVEIYNLLVGYLKKRAADKEESRPSPVALSAGGGQSRVTSDRSAGTVVPVRHPALRSKLS